MDTRKVEVTPIVTLDDVDVCPLTKEERDLVIDGVLRIFRVDVADISIFKRILAPPRSMKVVRVS